MKRASRSRGGRATLPAACVLACLATIPAVGQARPQFPPEIAAHLSASVEPACSVCHLAGKIGGITVVTPFALTLRAHGFTGSAGSLDLALDAMEADGADTDGDGVSDVDELRADTDPNSPVPGATTADPQYGCSITGRPGPGAWAALASVAAFSLYRRRRTGPARALTEREGPLSGAAARRSSACPREPL